MFKPTAKFIRDLKAEHNGVVVSQKQEGNIIFFIWKFRNAVYVLGKWNTNTGDGIIYSSDTDDSYVAARAQQQGLAA